MHIIAFHEINKDNLELTLKAGLKRTSRGDKGDDEEIIKTDKLLDDNRPAGIMHANVSNLDLYDEILQYLKRQNTTKATEIASRYWQQLTRLDNYDHSNGFNRPEIIVTYNVPASCLEVVKS
jgi:hypothetical protein